MLKQGPECHFGISEVEVTRIDYIYTYEQVVKWTCSNFETNMVWRYASEMMIMHDEGNWITVLELIYVMNV